MKRTFLLSTTIVMILCFVLGFTMPLFAKPVNFKLVSFFRKNTIEAEGIKIFIEQIDKKFENDVKIKWTGGPEVIPMFQQHEAVKKGVIDMCVTSPTFYPNYVFEAKSVMFTNKSHKELLDDNFFDVMKGEGKAHLPLQNDDGYVFGDYRPDKAIVDEYCTGIGASDELAAQFYENPLPAITNQSKDTQAVIGASHMQFLTKRSIARQVVPLQASKGLLRSETMGIDYKIDELGYLHLSTLKPYVFHMGNTLNERLIKEVQEITGTTKLPESATMQKTQDQGQKHKWLVRLAKYPRMNDLFLRTYNLLFRVLYAENEGK